MIQRPGLEQLDPGNVADGTYAVTISGGTITSLTQVVGGDVTAEAERIRDVIGAALVAGSGVLIGVDDTGDTITIATVTGSGEVLMTDGVTGPPVPLTTEDGADWLYQG